LTDSFKECGDWAPPTLTDSQQANVCPFEMAPNAVNACYEARLHRQQTGS